MKRIMLVAMVLIMTVFGIAGEKQTADINQPDNIDILVKSCNSFAFEMYGKLCGEQGNLFFSPYSVSSALAMVYAGAKGQTGKEMAQVLQVPVLSDSGCLGTVSAPWPQERYHSVFGTVIKRLNTQGQNGNYELAIANALWGQKGYGFLKEFTWLIERNYKGGLNQVDFITETEAARNTINQWAGQQTRDKIKDLIPPGMLSADTRLVLTNAIYFKGKWATQFKKEKTSDEPFYLADGNKTQVAMMKQTESFKYMQGDGFEAIELPYIENELSMLVFLPAKGTGLEKFEQKLSEKSLCDWQALFDKREVEVHLPRFTMNWDKELVPVLKSMGMDTAFTNGADFSGMTGKSELFISNVVHKAFVQVNEEGTEAAAATGVGMMLTSVKPKPVVFRADRPFVFIIKDNLTGTVLFIGRLAGPKE